jgi:dienelactone hydrolase
MRSFRMTVLCAVLCFLFSFTRYSANAQQLGVYTKRPNLNISPNCNGLLDYLPGGYDPNGTTRYPLLIFLMGINSHGDGSIADLEHLFSSGGGFPTDQMRDGIWVESYTVNGQTHKFIVITPQFITPFDVAQPSPQDVNAVINYSITNYKVDTTRIYLTGNSSGGGPVIDYIGADSASAFGYRHRIAAIVPFTPVAWPTQAKANVFKNNNIPVWGFANEFDTGVPPWFVTGLVDMINTPTPPSPPAKATIFPEAGHISWWHPYMRTYTENGLNIYQWMLQYTRTFSVLPVKFTMFNAQCENGKVKLLWKTGGETNSKDFYIERSANGSSWTNIGSLLAAGQAVGEKVYTYTDPSGNGKFYYRIVETGYDGQKTYSSVIQNNCSSRPSIALYPNPVRDGSSLTVIAANPGQLSYYVIDAKGSIVLRQTTMIPAGTSLVPVNTSMLPKGMYTLQASWEDENQQVKFIKN